MKSHNVSICIPVFNTEDFLEECLRSVALQSFTDYEVIVINDGSEGEDKYGNSCKKIVNKIKKEFGLDISLIEHERNEGLIESRRSAVVASSSDYIFNLDADDKLPPNALEELYKKACETTADIVQGKAILFEENAANKYSKVFDWENRISNVFNGELKEKEIEDGYLVQKNHSGFLWGKLIKRDVYLKAFGKIPYMYCTTGEDVLQYVFISYYAKSYEGIDKCVYMCRDNVGIRDKSVINTLSKWEQICSVSTVFSLIREKILRDEIKLSTEATKRIEELCRGYVANNLEQLNTAVRSDLKEEAYSILCDYWGESIVSEVEKKK